MEKIAEKLSAPSLGKIACAVAFLYTVVTSFPFEGNPLKSHSLFIHLLVDYLLFTGLILIHQFQKMISKFANKRARNVFARIPLLNLVAIMIGIFLWFLSKHPVNNIHEHLVFNLFFTTLFIYRGNQLVRRMSIGIENLQILQTVSNEKSLMVRKRLYLETAPSSKRLQIIANKVENLVKIIITSPKNTPEIKIEKVRVLSNNLNALSLRMAAVAQKDRKEKLFKRSRTRLLLKSWVLFPRLNLETSVATSLGILYFSYTILDNLLSPTLFALSSIVINVALYLYLQKDKPHALANPKSNFLFSIIFWNLATYFSFSAVQMFSSSTSTPISEKNFWIIYLCHLFIVTYYLLFCLITEYSNLSMDEIEALKFEVLNESEFIKYMNAREDTRIYSLISRRVHSSIQSLLIRHFDTPSLKDNFTLMTSISEILSENCHEEVPIEAIGGVLVERTAPWQGLMQIEIATEFHPSQLPRRVPRAKIEDIVSVVEDAILNGYRHGQSSLARITLSIDHNGHVLLNVLNNGKAPSEGKGGLGFSNFYRVFGEEWNLVNEGPNVSLRGYTRI